MSNYQLGHIDKELAESSIEEIENKTVGV